MGLKRGGLNHDGRRGGTIMELTHGWAGGDAVGLNHWGKGGTIVGLNLGEGGGSHDAAQPWQELPWGCRGAVGASQ